MEIGRGDVAGMVGVDQQNGETLAKLGGELATGTARRMATRRRDRESLKPTVASGDRCPERDSLGADRQTVGSVLDVAAADDLAGFGQQRGSHQELRVRSMSVLASFAGVADQVRLV